MLHTHSLTHMHTHISQSPRAGTQLAHFRIAMVLAQLQAVNN